MTSQQRLENSPFLAENRVLYLPDSWKRLISLIKHQAKKPGFYLIEAPFGAGKSTFGQLLEKLLVTDDTLDIVRVQVHPLSNIEQIASQLPKIRPKPLIVIIDDAHEAAASLLKRFTGTYENLYWVLLAEAGVAEQIADFQKVKTRLPTFSKPDCYEFLSKQLKSGSKAIELSQMQSDAIWYAAKGLPLNIIEEASKGHNKLIEDEASSNDFDKINKGWLTTGVLAIATIVFVVIMLLREPAEEKPKDKVSELSNRTLSILDDSKESSSSGGTDENAVNNEDKTVVDEQIMDDDPSKEQDILMQETLLEREGHSEDIASEETQVLDIDAETQVAASSQPYSNSSDPIEEIALNEVNIPAIEEAELVDVSVKGSHSFKDYLMTQSKEHYSIQLYSHTLLESAEDFRDSLDLADSYVYKALVNGQERYRVLWGVYPTRQEAELAIKSLPPNILAQKPWIRQLSAIEEELSLH